MTTMRLFIASACALGGAFTTAHANPAALPKDVKVAMSNLGPVFTDARGMTLYTWRFDAKPNISECNDDQPTTGHAFNSTFVYPLPAAPDRRTCAQKSPPLLASTDSPSNLTDWTVFKRKDGRMQWAFRGKALYTSIKDRRPGEINNGFGAWSPASAPLTNTPPGIKPKVTEQGVILGLANGKSLYVAPHGLVGSANCVDECARDWEPLPAPVTDWQSSDWSARNGPDGSPQWFYRGKPVFTHAKDLDPTDAVGLGTSGAELIVLHAPPRLPKEFRSLTLKGRTILTNAAGRTVYAFFCNEETTSHVACDDPGDAPIYRSSYCVDGCKSTFLPVVAPSGSKPIDNTWSVMKFDPENPLAKNINRSSALNVWAYRGRPVFIYSRDKEPGDTNGALTVIGTSSWRMISVDSEE